MTQPSTTVRTKDPYATLLTELRDPIAAIQGLLRTLVSRDDALSPEARRQLYDVALTHTERLDGLMDDAVVYIRLLASAVPVQPERIDVYGLVEALRHKLGETRRIANSVDPALTVVTDHDALEGALRRLLRNALIFGPREGIVTVTAETAENGLHVAVSDRGIGIPWDSVQRAFQPFDRAGHDAEQRRGGAGLGLAVARLLVLRMGGELLVRRSDEGLRAEIVLPLAPRRVL